MRFPSWGISDGLSKDLKVCLPDLVKIHLSGCSKLVQLPLMSQLPKLKALHLEKLESLEYVESNANGDEDSRQGEGDELVFFPSLQILELVKLPKLKRWGSHSNSYAFPQLNKLTIRWCGELTTFPFFPKGEAFYIDVHYDNLSFSSVYPDYIDFYRQIVKINSVNKGYIIKSLPADVFQRLPHLEIQELNDVKRLTGEVFQSKHVYCLLSLKIINCKNMRRLSELGEMRGHLTALEILELNNLPELVMEWKEEGENGSNKKKCENEEREIAEEDNDVTAFDMPWKLFASTLRCLVLDGLPKMAKLPRGMQCLTSPEVLELIDLPELELEWEEEDENGSNKNEEGEIAEEENVIAFDMPWKYFASTLRYLTLGLPNLEELPAWIGYFTSLDLLQITHCKKLQSLPQEMCQLTSLRSLELINTSNELYERCKKPSGADWPKIKHIPNIKIDDRRVQGSYYLC